MCCCSLRLARARPRQTQRRLLRVERVCSYGYRNTFLRRSSSVFMPTTCQRIPTESGYTQEDMWVHKVTNCAAPTTRCAVRHCATFVVSVVRAPTQWHRAFPGGREESAARRTRETCRGTAAAWRLDWR